VFACVFAGINSRPGIVKANGWYGEGQFKEEGRVGFGSIQVGQSHV
jgi:hypothetical protein